MKQSRMFNALLGLALLTTGAVTHAAKEKEATIEGLPAYGEDKPLVLPTVVEKRLGNGLTLWLIERTGPPLISMYLATRGGQAADPDNLKGVSTVLEATLSAGTTHRSSRQIVEELQALGADIDVGIGKDLAFIGIDGLASGADKLLEILADIAINASFPEAEVKLAIENALQGIIANRSQPTYDLDKVFYRHLFGSHPYSFINPDPKVIAQITRADLAKTYRQRFQPDQAIVVMVGNLSTQQMEALARKHFGRWEGKGDKLGAIPSASTAPRPALLLVDRPKSVQSSIYVGRPMPPAANPDEYPLEVANTIFGGAFGSRLTMNIREEKGYTYSPRASVTGWAKGGVFQVRASVRNEVTAATLVEIFYELDRLAATLPEEEELRRAQRYLKGSFLLANETSSSVAATLVAYWSDGKTPQDLARYVPGIERVSKLDVQRVGRRYLTSRQQSVAVSGDQRAIREPLSLFGNIEVTEP